MNLAASIRLLIVVKPVVIGDLGFFFYVNNLAVLLILNGIIFA